MRTEKSINEPCNFFARNYNTMKIKSFIPFLLVLFVVGIIACTPDDNSQEFVPERDRTEQQLADKDSLLQYLSTHYYNSGFFETGTNHRYSDIVITELDPDDDTVPEGHTLLIDAIDAPYQVEFAETDYEYYVLRINQGGGASPAFTDAVRVRYEGSLVTSASVFDEQSSPADVPLQGDGFTVFGTIEGWKLIMPTFNTAENFVIEDDGQVTYDNYGLGVMFLPSGLAYYSNFVTGIPQYSNLVFKFDLLQYEVIDHDNDLVLSFIEDLDGDGNVSNDDTDEDGIPNFLDVDDDGDGVITRFEDIDGDGDPTNDIGVNGIPKYLDPEETESNQDES